MPCDSPHMRRNTKQGKKPKLFALICVVLDPSIHRLNNRKLKKGKTW